MFWFTLSGWVGTAIFYVVYEWIHSVGADDARRPLCGVGAIDALDWSSLAWTSSYALSILWQHALHRYLVFGTAAPYLRSLVWTYLSYALSIVLSSVLNHALVSYIGVNHRVSFALTLVNTGVLNFYTVSSAFETPKTDAQAKIA